MANEIQAAVGVTGLSTVVARILQGVTQAGTDITMGEVTGMGGLYSANMPTLAAGQYTLLILVGGVLKVGVSFLWDGTKYVTADGRAFSTLPRLLRA